jgi:hypothetical protein
MTFSRTVQYLGAKSAEVELGVGLGVVEHETVGEVPGETLREFGQIDLVPASAVEAVRVHMDLRRPVQIGTTKLEVEGEWRVALAAEEVLNAVIQGLEHIYWAVEHSMVAHCTVKVLAGLVAALCVVPLVETRLMVGEHKRSTQTTQVDLEAVMAGAGQQLLETWHREEDQFL